MNTKSKVYTSQNPQCRECRKRFIPELPDQVVCSVECAAIYGPGLMHRRRKAAIKTIPQHLADLQKIFNKWIRLRDQHLPCVSCGKWHKGQWHAGHYKPVGGRSGGALRFDPANVHRQCSVCNNHLSGALTPYREELLHRIGQEEVERLEGPQELTKYTIEQIQELKKEYRQKIKDIEEYFPSSDGF